eukprot:342753-Prorocentrum_lima.AAC.1
MVVGILRSAIADADFTREQRPSFLVFVKVTESMAYHVRHLIAKEVTTSHELMERGMLGCIRQNPL